jgi:hypothetical protein
MSVFSARAPVEVVHRLYLPLLGSDQLGGAARFLDGFPRLGELHFLHPLLGNQEGDSLSLQFR